MSSTDSGDEVIDRNPPKNKKRGAKDDEPVSSKKAKKQNKVNSDGDEMLDLGNNRFVVVRSFKGKALVDIREFYEKDGKTMPGKKGISLSRDQFNTFKNLIDEIDAKLNDI